MNNKNTILSAIAVFAVFVGLVWIAQPKTNANTPPITNQKISNTNALNAPEKFYDFDEISMKNGKVSHVFKIKNATEKPIIISRMYTSCMCTTVALTLNGEKSGPFGMPGHVAVPKINREIKPGEEADVEAVFDPAAHGPAGIGRIQREIIFEGTDNLLLKLSFAATVKP